MDNRGLASYKWQLDYKTSDLHEDGTPVDVYREFYAPALSMSVQYDRIAGYFRSSSLAAAAEGYSAFIGKNGKMRLIVGADMDPDDVRAILAGDQLRMEQKLTGELHLEQPMPTNVRNGLNLLSWMVAKGILEIRVAFRLHRETGDPIGFDSTEDGYFHEKWLILSDEYGHRLYGGGSLNESKTALIRNAENIDIHCDWDNQKDFQRVEKACHDFEELWENKRKHIPVKTLPEAVQAKLIKLSEGVSDFFEVDGTRIVNPAMIKPSALEILQFAMIQDAPMMPGGQFVGMYTAPVEPWPHQEIVIRRLIETYPNAYLLCDEVGLGKTIEAGLAIRSLYLSGMAQRILIAAPASLTNQWQREMMYKAVLPFARTTTLGGIKRNYLDPYMVESELKSLYAPDLNIISTGILARKERQREIRDARSFDIVLIDEAHYARRRNPADGLLASPQYGHLYQTVSQYIRDKASVLWLATATPLQINPVEVYDLIALTRRTGAFQDDPSLTLLYFRIMGQLVSQGIISADEWTLIARSFQQLLVQDPYLYNYIQETCLKSGVAKSLITQLLEGRRNLPKSDWRYLTRAFYASSPLTRVMMRHSRELLKIYRDRGELNRKLAERNVLPMKKIQFTAAELKCYEHLKEYCDGLSEQIAKNADKQTRQMMFFLLSFLRLRFASSLYAIKQTLYRRRERVKMTIRAGNQAFRSKQELDDYLAELNSAKDDDTDEGEIIIDFDKLLKNRSLADLEWEHNQLDTMLAELDQLQERPSKMEVLLEIIEQRRERVGNTGRIEQMVIFTRFMDTLRDIRQNLISVRQDFRIGVYSGSEYQFFDARRMQARNTNSEEVKKRFIAGEIDILLCTDAAAEGLNLQTANLIVNYDLGWNPMKIEQRIGRIDRIGQKHDRIHVLNFCYLGSSEEVVYDRLLSRLHDANLIVGMQQISMLPIEPDEFRQLEDGSLTEEKLEQIAKQRIQEQKARQQSMEMRAEEQYQMYKVMSENAKQQPLPVTLDQIWQTINSSQFMKRLGIVYDPQETDLLNIGSTADVGLFGKATINRELFERTEQIRFLTYGEPVLERIIQLVLNSNIKWPSCIRKIQVESQDFPGKLVFGYVVAVKEGKITDLRLLTRLDQLQDLELAEEIDINDSDLPPFIDQLSWMVKESFNSNLMGKQAIPYNLQAADLHKQLLNLVASSLLANIESTTQDSLFWPAIAEMNNKLETTESINLQLDVNELKSKSGYPAFLLFDIKIPQVGNLHVIKIPATLARLAFEHTIRVADSLKRGRRELTVGEVLRKLKM